MGQTTYYVLQEFEFVRKHWQPKLPREISARDIAIRAAERIRSSNKPVIAFARTGDPTTGEFGEAEILAWFNVPPEFVGDQADV